MRVDTGSFQVSRVCEPCPPATDQAAPHWVGRIKQTTSVNFKDARKGVHVCLYLLAQLFPNRSTHAPNAVHMLLNLVKVLVLVPTARGDGHGLVRSTPCDELFSDRLSHVCIRSSRHASTAQSMQALAPTHARAHVCAGYNYHIISKASQKHTS